MKPTKFTARQLEVLRAMGPGDLRTLRKYPKLLREGKQLMKALKKVIKQVEALHRYANARKRETAYKRIARVCTKALERVEA